MNALPPNIIYGRTSKDDKRRLTIENQQQSLYRWRQFDDSCGSTLLECWEVGVSGKIPFPDRPGGRRVLEIVRQQAGRPVLLVVPYVDRFARDTLSGIATAKELNGLGTKIVSVAEGLDARRDESPLAFNMRLCFAEEEWFRINDRTSKGKLRAMERDNAPPGGGVIFGFRLLPDGKWEKHPIESLIVTHCFEMLLEGSGQKEIAAWLQSLSFLPRGRAYQKRDGGAPHYFAPEGVACWSQARVSKLLHCRAYIGERRWGKRVFPVPALIGADLFERVQAKLADRHSRNDRRRYADQPALLSGLLTCKACGGSFHGIRKRIKLIDNGTNQSAGDDGFGRVYRCQNTSQGTGLCHAKQFPASALDSQVWPLLRELLENPGQVLAKVVHADRQGQLADASRCADAEGLRKILAKLDTEIAGIWEMQERNGWPLATVEKGIQKAQERRGEVLRQLETLRVGQLASERDREEVQSVASRLSSLRQQLSAAEASPAVQAQIARVLVKGGTVRTVRPGRWGEVEVSLELKWGESLLAAVPRPQGPNVKGRPDSCLQCQESERPLTLPFTFIIGRRPA